MFVKKITNNEEFKEYLRVVENICPVWSMIKNNVTVEYAFDINNE